MLPNSYLLVEAVLPLFNITCSFVFPAHFMPSGSEAVFRRFLPSNGMIGRHTTETIPGRRRRSVSNKTLRQRPRRLRSQLSNKLRRKMCRHHWWRRSCIWRFPQVSSTNYIVIGRCLYPRYDVCYFLVLGVGILHRVWTVEWRSLKCSAPLKPPKPPSATRRSHQSPRRSRPRAVKKSRRKRIILTTFYDFGFYQKSNRKQIYSVMSLVTSVFVDLPWSIQTWSLRLNMSLVLAQGEHSAQDLWRQVCRWVWCICWTKP